MRKHIFLVDGIGAVITAAIHGLLLPKLENQIGLPATYFYPLALLAASFALYSFYNYFVIRTIRNKALLYIASANLGFCAITSIFILINYLSITPLGYIYFMVEFSIVVALSIFEIRQALA